MISPSKLGLYLTFRGADNGGRVRLAIPISSDHYLDGQVCDIPLVESPNPNQWSDDAHQMNSAWYVGSREQFTKQSVALVVGELARNAVSWGLKIEPQQEQEWQASVGALQRELTKHAGQIEVLHTALAAPDLQEFTDIILEFDFRRRGLRIDCVLLGAGIVAVIEFKRSEFAACDREQVSNYALNLVEFHEETRYEIERHNAIVVPILALTSRSATPRFRTKADFHRPPWSGVVSRPIECDGAQLREALSFSLGLRRASHSISRERWLASRFSPSSTILDAAISLYGQHDVSAIKSHAAPRELIDRCAAEVTETAKQALECGVNRIVFVSGAPGAGKTLVGLKIAFSPDLRQGSVFVSGNAPLIEVLTEALEGAYRRRSGRTASITVASGYARDEVARVIAMSTFKLVKAHNFLRSRGSYLSSTDGRVLVFDEAQRTYEKGRRVLGETLEEDEARLILKSLMESHPNGAVVVALVGHNQAINRGELGIAAWFSAAAALGWRYSISDATLSLDESFGRAGWGEHPLRDSLEVGHLPHSMRYYRNSDVERWAGYVLDGDCQAAAEVAHALDTRGDSVWLTRDLQAARKWVRDRRVGEERAGIIASGQARRLAAEGLFVDLKPPIAEWMLAPSGDSRSSNMLETVQNQFRVQGLELDYTVVCWDADLRRAKTEWSAHKMHGADWIEDSALDVAKNSYRVLLTRARKGMVVFVPVGDTSVEDVTRNPAFYENTVDFLLRCGARLLPLA